MRLALCLPGLCAYAEEPEREVYRSADFKYAILEGGTAEITIYNGNAETLIVGRDSYAQKYCKENGLSYTCPDANDQLNGRELPDPARFPRRVAERFSFLDMIMLPL